MAVLPHRPGRPPLAVEQAIEAVRAGNPGEAERTLRAHLLVEPADALAWGKLGELLRDRGNGRDAISHFRRALAINPNAFDIRVALASLLQQCGKAQDALDQLDLLPEEARSGFDVRVFWAALLGSLGQHQEEIALYEALVRERPGRASLWLSLGTALNYAGRTPDAVKAMRKAVQVRKTYGEGWWGLANLKSVHFSDRDLSVMRSALRAKPAAEDSMHLHFALGSALEQRKLYQQSFRHYAEGNAARARTFRPEQMTVTSFVDHAIETFDGCLFKEMEHKGNSAGDPIFIVGLQRSGSTLVEQILATHPMIEGTSELLVMQQIWTDLTERAFQHGRTPWEQIRKLSAEQLRTMGAEYIDRTRSFRQTDRPLFVDKLPANWMNVGLIRLILPNAKIIDARRHPLACGFSNFKQHYATGVAFSYDLETIGRFYVDYLRLMEHFDKVQPGAIHHVLNEKLVEDPEGEVRRLLRYSGVPFDPICLEFHSNRRAVKTPSAEQVRRPINRDGLEQWVNYEPWLGPLKSALGQSLGRWDRLAA